MSLEDDVRSGFWDTLLYGVIFLAIDYWQTGMVAPVRWAITIPVLFVFFVFYSRYLEERVRRLLERIF
jgi:hypothetical protein